MYPIAAADWKLTLTGGCRLALLLSIVSSVQSSVRFITEPNDIVTTAGKTIRLDCEAKFDSVATLPQIRWRFPDGQYFDFIGDKRRSILQNGSLLIKNIFNDDEKDSSEGFEAYQCVAFVDNIGSAVSRIATITLAHLSPFEKQPTNLKLFPGQTAHFSCSFNSQPTPKVTWIKDHSPLIIDARMTIFPSGALEIDDVHKGDNGDYQCNVTGLDRHRTSASGKLTIDENEDNIKKLKPPEFVSKPHSTVVLEGSIITLDCAAIGNPRPQISWLKDGTLIDIAHLDSRFSIIGTGGLQITQVNKNDDGNYVCRAENHEDSADASATLEVQIKPQFIRKPKDTMVLEKEDIILECEVAGKPPPRVTWLKNGDKIKQDEYLQFVSGTNLKILGLMTMDSGMFQCLASNPAGNIQSSAFLNVFHADALPSSNSSTNISSDIINSFSVAEKPKDLKNNLPSPPRALEARLVASRLTTLIWNNPLKPNGEIITYTVFYQQEGSDRERMTNTSQTDITITGLTPDKHYLFRVVAVNEYGIGESSPRLKVMTKAEINIPGPPLNVTAKSTSPSSIFVSWSRPEHGSENLKEYKLFYMKDLPSSEERSFITKHTDHEIRDLNPYTKYKIWVVAYNQNGPGMNSLEVIALTKSSAPTQPPQNIIVDAISSTEIGIRWEHPPVSSQNGVITGYKIRYRKQDRKISGDTITTAGDHTEYQIVGLDKNSFYQVRLWTLNTVGSSPPSEWLTVLTFDNNLKENTVPDAPTNFKVRSFSNSLLVTWSPPLDKSIIVREYTLAWGKGVPDVYVEKLSSKTRQYEIKNLEQNVDYILSLAAVNEMGVSPLVYQLANIREQNIGKNTLEASNPILPPIGLKTYVISPNAIEVSWTDNSISDLDLNVEDERLYLVRYNAYSPNNARYKYVNTTELSCIINDLKPNTQYEFTVKLIKGQFESEWSLLVMNNTQEAKPASPPRDLTAVKNEDNSQTITLNWQPPKFSNGQIIAYLLLYTTDDTSPDNDWIPETIEGELMSYVVKGLTPNTNYFFKIQAKNAIGYGPFSTTINIKTSLGGLPYNDGTSLKDGKSGINNTTILYILIACCLLLISCIGIGIALLCCKQNKPLRNRSKKGYIKGSTGKTVKGAQSPSIKPPDLWIHHDQMELKSMEKSSQGSLDTSSGCGQGSTNTYDGPDTRVTIHHVPQSTSTLEKSNYVTSYVDNTILQPLLSEEKVSTLKRFIPKPVVLPDDSFHYNYNDAMASLPNQETRSQYQKSQYATATRAHVTVDLTAGVPENNYIVQATAIPDKFESIPVSSTTILQQQHTGSLNTSEKRQQGHPLKSFSVPAPPPQSAPSTPQQKHIVTVRPQGSSSPYKKNNYAAINNSPSITSMSGGTKTWKSPLTGVNQRDTVEVESLSKIQTSYSTEELNQEMANLEGLMKDLSAITASEFQC